MKRLQDLKKRVISFLINISLSKTFLKKRNFSKYSSANIIKQGVFGHFSCINGLQISFFVNEEPAGNWFSKEQELLLGLFFTFFIN